MNVHPTHQMNPDNTACELCLGTKEQGDFTLENPCLKADLDDEQMEAIHENMMQQIRSGNIPPHILRMMAEGMGVNVDALDISRMSVRELDNGAFEIVGPAISVREKNPRFELGVPGPMDQMIAVEESMRHIVEKSDLNVEQIGAIMAATLAKRFIYPLHNRPTRLEATRTIIGLMGESLTKAFELQDMQNRTMQSLDDLFEKLESLFGEAKDDETTG